jgi:hypothetical protein
LEKESWKYFKQQEKGWKRQNLEEGGGTNLHDEN